jgi:ribose transport system ATP-binding protein
VLVLDEPTSSLPASEVDILLAALRRYAAAGQTILLVTHRFDEVTAVADRATMLRDGRHVGTVERDELTQDVLIELMLGRPVDRLVRQRVGRRTGEVLLRCRDLRGGKVDGASFEVREGEIVGLAGLLGSGRSTLLRLLFGLTPRHGGEVELGAAALAPRDPADAIAAGLAYVPEDRARDAVFAEMTVAENMGMAVIPRYWRHGRFARGAERHDARELMARFGVKATSERARFASLSGGNQQKAILARWMRCLPRLILLDEPTQGVDIGARLELYALIRDAVEAGAAAVVVSSELEELEALCDRALIMRQGRIVGEVDGDDLHADNLERLAHRGGVAA